MLYVNDNENYGDNIEFESLEEFREAIDELGYEEPDGGLQQGRDYHLKYDENDEEEFISEFEMNAPIGYDLNKDLQSSNPWATPWIWNNSFQPTEDPREDARNFAREVYDELSDILDEEEPEFVR